MVSTHVWMPAPAPVVQHHFYCRHRLGKVMSFDKKTLNGEIVGRFYLRGRCGCGKKYKGDAFSSQVLFFVYSFSQLEAVHDRHVDIAKDNEWFFRCFPQVVQK